MQPVLAALAPGTPCSHPAAVLRLLRALAILVLLVLVVPVVWIVARGLVEDRDLRAGWRALRAPRPTPVSTPVSAPAAPFGPPLHVGSLRDAELSEVSGLAASRRSPDLLWAVNDGGNPLRLYALSHQGEVRKVYDVDLPVSATETDWEDLAAFDYAGRPYLVIADVGDNQSWRRSVRLWIVEEPEPTRASSRVTPRWRIELRYADGPHDCEAVAVDSADATALLVSKRTAPPVLYQVELAPLLEAGGGEAMARPVAGLSGIPPPSSELAETFAPSALHMPTALDLASDGSAALVLSYAAAWYFPRRPGESWAEALSAQPSRIALPSLALAEAAAFAGRSWFVSSEVDPFVLFRWRAPLVRFDPLEPMGREAAR